MSTQPKLTVCLTNSTGDNLSRYELLDWVNKTVDIICYKIDHLSTGVAYCKLMELICPNIIGIKKIKLCPKIEYESVYNMKLLQGALNRLKVEKSVPIETLVAGSFRDNLEFLQWFKKFYDTYRMAPSKDCAKIAIKETPSRIITLKLKEVKHKAKETDSETDLKESQKLHEINKSKSRSLKSALDYKEALKGIEKKLADIEIERNCYHKILQKIEEIMEEEIGKKDNQDSSRQSIGKIKQIIQQIE